MTTMRLDMGDDLIELIARRAAELVQQSSGESDDGWLRGADKIADYIDSPRSRVYALVSARRIPVHHDGSALIAHAVPSWMDGCEPEEDGGPEPPLDDVPS